MKEYQLNNQQTLLLPQRNQDSRYVFTKYIKNIDNTIVFDLFKKLDYSNNNDVTYHIVTEQESNRLDKIALKYYRNTAFWWLIAMANNMIDPFILTAGTTLKVPSLNSFIVKGMLNG